MDKIKTVGDDFLASFNEEGKITSLVAGSFNTSKVKKI
jgi:hypothetical protein